jgi:hypothetical protein
MKYNKTSDLSLSLRSRTVRGPFTGLVVFRRHGPSPKPVMLTRSSDGQIIVPELAMTAPSEPR